MRVTEGTTRAFQQFARAQSTGGFAVLVCVAIALVWANSRWAAGYFQLWGREFTIGGPMIGLTQTVHDWINNGLMAVVLFVLGLELKRELLVGELASARRAALPVAAAVGGMIVPGLLYSVMNADVLRAAGWGVPMATDIAVALAVLALLGDRVPPSLRVFLVTVAIINDIGSALATIVVHTAPVSSKHLAVAGSVVAALAFCNTVGVRHPIVYTMGGIALWVAALKSGVHASVAGVALAMTIPSRTRIDSVDFLARVRGGAADFERSTSPDTDDFTNAAQQEAVGKIRGACERVQLPLTRVERGLNSTTAFVILPLFALANAGVRVPSDLGSTIGNPIGLGVIIGLLVGKPLGILTASWLAVWASVAALPPGTSWKDIHGVSVLAAVGLTMSLFVAELGFPSSARLDTVKFNVLAGSLIATALGWLVLRSRTAAIYRGEETVPQASR